MGISTGVVNLWEGHRNSYLLVNLPDEELSKISIHQNSLSTNGFRCCIYQVENRAEISRSIDHDCGQKDKESKDDGLLPFQIIMLKVLSFS